MRSKRTGWGIFVTIIFLISVFTLGCKSTHIPASNNKSERSYKHEIVLPSGFQDEKTDAYEFVVGTGGNTLPCIKFINTNGNSTTFCGDFKIISQSK